MKKGTLLLAIALLLQGSAAWGVLGTNPVGLSKKDRRAAQKARKKARDAKAATQESVTESTAFEIVFGPVTQPADYVSNSEDGKAEDLAASARDEAADAVAAATEAADAQLAATADSDASKGEEGSGAGVEQTGWFDTLLGRTATEQTAEELAAQADAELKQQQEATAETFKEAVALPGVQATQAAIPNAADQMASLRNEKEAQRAVVRKAIKTLPKASLEHKEVVAKGLFAEVIAKIAQKEKTPSFDKQYSNFENTTSKRSVAAKQLTHSAVWKAATDPSNPENIIGLLQKSQVADNEVAAYQHYIDQAISRIATSLETSHARRDGAQDVPTKRNICAVNGKLAWQLMTLLELAKQQELPVSKQSEGMVLHWLAKNEEAIAELETAHLKEIAQFKGAQTQNDVADRLEIRTLRDRISLCRQVEPKAFNSGCKKASNMAEVIRISTELAQELEAGTASLNDVALFVAAIQEKDIPLDLDSLRSLRNAIIVAQDRNNETVSAQAQQSLSFEENAETLSNDLCQTILERFTSSDDLSEKKTPFVDHIGEFDFTGGWDENTEWDD